MKRAPRSCGSPRIAIRYPPRTNYLFYFRLELMKDKIDKIAAAAAKKKIAAQVFCSPSAVVLRWGMV